MRRCGGRDTEQPYCNALPSSPQNAKVYLMSTILEVNKLTKNYGKSRGVNNITIKVPKGSVFGFLGPNGAGKTTTISTVVDLIHPTSGNIKVFGLDSRHDSLQIRRKIGFLAGDMALDGALTGHQQLEYFGNLRRGFDADYVNELASKLSCDLSRKIKSLSRGNRQKIALISALMHKPELLILDEPTSGLDPLIQAEFNQIILDFKASGKTAFISSHILDEVEEICDHVAFIKDGKIVAHDSIHNIINSLPEHVTLTHLSKKGFEKLKELPGVNELEQYDGVVTFTYSADIHKLIKMLADEKFDNISIGRPDLETIFMKYYKG